MQALADFFKRQLSAKSLPRITIAVVIVVGAFWLAQTTYREWQVMRIVNVITQTLQHMPPSSPPQKINTDDTRV